MSNHIELESEAFGLESFLYDTKREASQGFNRLVKSAQAQYAKDGIDRTVTQYHSGTIVQWDQIGQPIPAE